MAANRRIGRIERIGRPVTSVESADAQLLRVLHDQHAGALWGYVIGLLDGDRAKAQDVVQETFLRAARSPESVPLGSPNEEAWLVRVLINICRDRWRHASVRARAAAEGHLRPGAASSPEAGILARAMVWQALGALPPRRRAIVILYELEGATIPAIADLLGVTPVTVRWHLSIGRREMAKALGGKP